MPVSSLFRDGVEPDPRRPRLFYLAAFAVALAGLTGVAVLFAYDRRVALLYIGASGLIFVLLRLLATGLMRLAARVRVQ